MSDYTPRLKEKYNAEILPALMKQFEYTSKMQAPMLKKITVNMGMGKAKEDPRRLEAAVNELTTITGQKAVVTKAKKAISNFKLRAGDPVGARVTLHGNTMWEFLDRFISTAIPRIRDFRGLNTRAFDGRGNYSLGIKEQMIFPEVNYDLVEQIHGMDLTFVTTTNRDDMAFALLRELGMPFRGDDKPIVVQG